MKKILATGVILLSTSTFVASASAQTNETLLSASGTQYGTIDNRNNPMNTPLGSVEDQYPKSPIYTSGSLNNSYNSTSTGYIFDNKIGRELWQKFHCAMLTR